MKMENKRASALWHEKNVSRVIHSDLPEPGTGEVIIQGLYSCISLGTELLVARGQVPSEAFAAMVVPHMEGSFSLPVKYGYSVAGRILESGNPELRGKLIHCMHPHQDRFVAREADLQQIPENVPPGRAALTANMETIINAMWDSRISPGESVLIVGFGLIGSLLTRCLLQIPGVTAEVFEMDPEREKSAHAMGFEVTGKLQPNHYDKVFHCSGSADGLQRSIEAVKSESPVIELSWYGTKDVKLQLGGSFHYGRKQIISSQVSSIPPHKANQWDVGRRKRLALKMLEDPAFDQHIDRMVSLNEAAELFNLWRKGKPEGLSYMIDYNL